VSIFQEPDRLAANAVSPIGNSEKFNFRQPELTLAKEEIEPSREFVVITCKKCGHERAIDCVDAGLS
jgi:hypothetical protein